MKDRPITFSAPMVLALLREIEWPGTGKTQTRRVLNPQPDDIYEGQIPHALRISPGDCLYVREAWRTFVSLDKTKPSDLYIPDRRGAGILYEADDMGLAYSAAGKRTYGPRDDRRAFGKLRPAMYMPKWASRISLAVTEVRVQRLWEISESDAIAEGVERWEPYNPAFHNYRDYMAMPKSGDGNLPTAVDSYRTLWDSLNATRNGGIYAWERNPWIVAISFKPGLRDTDD